MSNSIFEYDAIEYMKLMVKQSTNMSTYRVDWFSPLNSLSAYQDR